MIALPDSFRVTFDTVVDSFDTCGNPNFQLPCHFIELRVMDSRKRLAPALQLNLSQI
jgi:hypothetical protein